MNTTVRSESFHLLGEQVAGTLADAHTVLEAFAEGDEIPLRVIEFDSKNRKIVLSVEAYYSVRERDDLDNFLAEHPTRTLKIKDVVEEEVAEPAKVETKPEPEPKAEAVEEPEAEADSKAEPETIPEVETTEDDGSEEDQEDTEKTE